jgi:hypothetical protein
MVVLVVFSGKKTPAEAEEILAKISKNHDDWEQPEPTPEPTPEPIPTPILKKRWMIELNDEVMREAKKSLKEKGIKSEDVKNLPPIEELCKPIPPPPPIGVGPPGPITYSTSSLFLLLPDYSRFSVSNPSSCCQDRDFSISLLSPSFLLKFGAIVLRYVTPPLVQVEFHVVKYLLSILVQ